MVNEGLGDELYTKLNSILDDIATLPVPGLGWLFIWDTIRDVVQDIEDSVDGDTAWGDYVMAPDVDLKKVWDTLWENPWGGFDIEGSDVIDWLDEKGVLVMVKSDSKMITNE